MAELLASSGERVITLGRRSVPELLETARAHGTDWTELVVELGDQAQTQKVGQALISLLEGVQTARIIHNAGIVSPIAPADQLADLEAIGQAFDVNIVAPIYLTSCFLKATQTASDRRIMLISSGAGRNASHSWGVYCATKAAMDRYAEAVKVEAHPGVKVCSMAPGVIDTPMQETIRSTSLDLFPNRKRFEDMHRNGILVPPEVTATRLLTLLGRDDFGDRAIDDVRQHSFES